MIGEASDGLAAVAKGEDLRPDVIVLDIGLPQLNGIEAARRLRRNVAETIILFVSQITDRNVVRTALSVGNGHVVKTDAKRELLSHQQKDVCSVDEIVRIK